MNKKISIHFRPKKRGSVSGKEIIHLFTIDIYILKIKTYLLLVASFFVPVFRDTMAKSGAIFESCCKFCKKL